MNTSPLGGFTVEHTCADGRVAYLRGLTVAEYVDLAQRGFFSGKGPVSQASKMTILQSGLKGWDSSTLVQDATTYEGWSPLEIAEEEEIPLPELIKMADIILTELTSVSKELDNKLRGYTRYIHKMSKPENQREAESFNCQKCILSGKHQSRRKFCGKFTSEQAASIKTQLEAKSDEHHLEVLEFSIREEAKEVAALEAVEEASNKYRGSRKKRGRKRSQQASADARREYMTINKFKFPECPVSWLDEWIWISGTILYDAEKNGVPLFNGGLFDQPYKMYQCARAVASEFSKIDYEEHKAQNK